MHEKKELYPNQCGGSYRKFVGALSPLPRKATALTPTIVHTIKKFEIMHFNCKWSILTPGELKDKSFNCFIDGLHHSARLVKHINATTNQLNKR